MSSIDAIGAGLLLAPAAYAGVMAWLRGQWQDVSVQSHEFAGRHEVGGLTFSVLVAARNEAANLPRLLADFAAQTLPAARFEVIVIDDHSMDETARIVRAVVQTSPFRLRLLQLAQLPNQPTGKKAALAAALAQAAAPWIVCTDADCRVGPNWLEAYAGLLTREPGTRFISGPVLLTGTNSPLQKLMGLEFAGLIGVGAATLAAGRPTMCNGANLAYRLETFRAVGGFAGNEQLASGDDEFLLHKIHAAFPGSVRFLADPAAVVCTAAPASLKALLRQRVRWASKWQHYQSAAPRWLALLVLAANVALGAGLVAGGLWSKLWPWVAAACVLKLAADVWFLAPVLGFFKRRRWLWLVPLLQLAYGPYALGVGLAGLRGGYEWKGRAVR
jgi:glycosyltransferase involved in cell wall biosynthesis